MKSTSHIQPLFTDFVAAVFILLFVYTGLSKLMDMQNFEAVLHRSPLIGNHAHLVAIMVPVLEITVSLLVLLPRTRILGLLGAFIIMSLFTLYLGYMITFIPHLPCTCGGVIRKMSWKQHLLFNSFFIVLALLAIGLERRRLRRSNSYKTAAGS